MSTNGLVLRSPGTFEAFGSGSQTISVNSNGSVSFSSCSSISLNSVFSSSYDNYMMSIRCSSDTNGASINYQWRNDRYDVTTGYYSMSLTADNTTLTRTYDVAGTPSTYGRLFEANSATKEGALVYIMNLGASGNTVVRSTAASSISGSFLIDVASNVINTGVHDGITILPSSGTITGSLTIYALED